MTGYPEALGFLFLWVLGGSALKCSSFSGGMESGTVAYRHETGILFVLFPPLLLLKNLVSCEWLDGAGAPSNIYIYIGF